MDKKMNKDWKNMLIGFGVILLYLVLSSLSQEFIELFGINYSNLNFVVKQIYSLLYEASLISIIIYIYRKDLIPCFKDFIKNNVSYFKKYIKYWFLSLALIMLSNLIIINFTTTEVSANQEYILEVLKQAPIYTFITTVIFAPILEELVFRLSFRKIFAHTDILFIIFSGLIFGSMHVLGSLKSLTDLLFIIPYSIPGFVFAYTLCKSKNVCVPISLHFIHNGISMCLEILLMML